MGTVAGYPTRPPRGTAQPLARLPARRRHRQPVHVEYRAETFLLPNLEEIPEWIHGPRLRAYKTLGLITACIGVIDLAYLAMRYGMS